MLYGDGTFDASYYGETVPYLYHLEDDGLGLSIGGIFKTVARTAAGFVPGGGAAFDIATGIIGGNGAVSDQTRRDLADQQRYFELAVSGNDPVRVFEGGPSTGEQRLRWEASSQNSGNPAEQQNAKALLAQLAEIRRQRLLPPRPLPGALPPPGAPTPAAPGFPTAAPIGTAADRNQWILPAALIGGALLLPALLKGRR